ncbi:hypothetical protein [Muribaculum sp. NM65_B17]|uniref:hypothetical protein n=1 Tax=Muribaculum sp. NM65_B17 TaxID=2516961 RepID=UPI00109374E4|nr:hypothetical protein [Muribaculum sp. NM65_B17]TGY05944.1 hypothetical protein E5354_02460 [Muribaculum sp. NM65_B17]THG43537.1 hypothetical protein E5985_04620 [Muribaculaceae bacterium]
MVSSYAQKVSQIWNFADDILEFCRIRRSGGSLYHEYNQNEGFQDSFRNLHSQIIYDRDYREVVDLSEVS